MNSIIVATAKNGVIGKTGGLPWYLPADLAKFKQITTGNPIVMGRVTHESIGKPLPERRNIVISTQKNYQAHGCEVVDSLKEALSLVKNEEEVFVIGGASIYGQALPLCQKIYLTDIQAQIDGDKFFKYNPSEWEVISSETHKADDKNKYDFIFKQLVRK